MPPQRDADRLLDALIRHQIFLEGLKQNYRSNIGPVTSALRREIRGILFDLPVERFDALSQRQLNKIIREIQKRQRKTYSVYTEQLLRDLREFMVQDIAISQVIVADVEDEETPAINTDKVWAAFLAGMSGVAGIAPVAYLQRFVANTLFQTESYLRRAHADRLSLDEAVKLLTGTAKFNYRDGALSRSGAQGAVVAATLLQQAAVRAQAAVFSSVYREYRWVAVLDSRTSDVCRERHGRVWKYGEGPLPPAHPNCRSVAVPVVPGSTEPASLSAWLSRQPDAVRKAAQRSATPSSLTLSQFVGKLRLMLAR